MQILLARKRGHCAGANVSLARRLLCDWPALLKRVEAGATSQCIRQEAGRIILESPQREGLLLELWPPQTFKISLANWTLRRWLLWGGTSVPRIDDAGLSVAQSNLDGDASLVDALDVAALDSLIAPLPREGMGSRRENCARMREKKVKKR